MSRGRRNNREAYVLEEWDLPKPVPDAEWQHDKAFNLADELLRDPEIKTVFKVALEKGAETLLLTRNFSSPGRSLNRTCLMHSTNRFSKSSLFRDRPKDVNSGAQEIGTLTQGSEPFPIDIEDLWATVEL